MGCVRRKTACILTHGKGLNMKKKIDLKERISIIITAINFATHLMPFVIMLPLLFMITIFSNELDIEWLGTILTFVFLISIVVYVIGVFLAPLIQFVLMIVAVIRKKWWLVGVHIVSAILLGGGIVLFIMVAEQMAYAT